MFILAAQSTTEVDASDYIMFDMVTAREVNPIGLKQILQTLRYLLGFLAFR